MNSKLLRSALICALLLFGALACDPDTEELVEAPDAAVPDPQIPDAQIPDAQVEPQDATDPQDTPDTPPPFHPSDLPGLSLFFDADHIDSLMMSSQGLVAMWSDLSGDDNHAYQAIDRLMPVHRPDGQAGRAVLDFDRSYLTTSDVLQLRATGDGYTVFAVASNSVADDTGGDEGRGGVLLGNFRRPHSSFAVELHHDRRLRHWWDRREAFGDPADENRGDAIFDAPRPGQDAFAILTFYLDTSTDTVGAAVDGEFAEPLPDDGFVFEVQRPLRIGADYREQNLPTSWKGSIGELLVYDRLLTETEMEEIHQHLSQKWEIPLHD